MNPRRKRNISQAMRKARVQAAERRARAVELIKQKKTLQEIADELGVVKSAVWKMIHGYVDQINARAIEQTAELRQEQLDRLEALIEAALPKAVASAAKGDLSQLGNLVRLLERQAKLAGLDAAIVLEHQGASGGPIQISDARTRLLSRVNDIAKRLEGEIASATDAAAEPIAR